MPPQAQCTEAVHPGKAGGAGAGVDGGAAHTQSSSMAELRPLECYIQGSLPTS